METRFIILSNKGLLDQATGGVDRFQDLGHWFEHKAGLKGNKLATAMNQCYDGLVESVPDLQQLHSAGQLVELFPQSMLRGLVIAALKKEDEAIAELEYITQKMHGKLEDKDPDDTRTKSNALTTHESKLSKIQSQATGYTDEADKSNVIHSELDSRASFSPKTRNTIQHHFDAYKERTSAFVETCQADIQQVVDVTNESVEWAKKEIARPLGEGKAGFSKFQVRNIYYHCHCMILASNLIRCPPGSNPAPCQCRYRAVQAAHA